MPDSVPQTIVNWIREQGWQLQHTAPLSGGCVAQVIKLSVVAADGQQQQWVLKTGGTGFSAEAAGLQALADTQALVVPEVLYSDDECLLMEFLAQAPKCADFDEILGEGLARQHQCRSDRFGFGQTTYCGGTAQPNGWQRDGYRFFAEQRLMALGIRCHKAGLLSTAELRQLERVSQKLPELIPEQPPALLHGDLWSGNVTSDANGKPALIDPAVYFGWGEADLAMTLMFGGFSERFYRAYQSVQPLESGWRKRADIYNLYHYLNHLLLFGGGYHSDVQRIVKYY